MGSEMCIRDRICWLIQLLADMGFSQTRPTILRLDNQGAIALGENPMISEKSKHVKLRYHYVREQCRDGFIKFEWVTSKHQLADFLTKSIDEAAFSYITNTVMGASKMQDEVH